MIKVGDSFAPDPGSGLTLGPSAESPAVDPVAFRQQLAYHGTVVEDQSVDRMLTDVQKQAKQLLANPSMGEVAVYRDLIRSFLKNLAPRLGKLDKRTDRRNRTLVIIRNLDDKLEALTKSVIENQGRGIDLLALLGEIHGLLLDLLV